MNSVLFVVLMIIILLAAIIFIPQLMIRRAISAVIRIFRKKSAVSESSAKSLDELGLKPRGFIDRMMKPRDYKPQAMQLLMKVDIIRMTEDGRLYLSEEKLASTRWRGNMKY